MALQDFTSYVPGLFDRALQGNITQLQAFMNEFLLKILSEFEYNTELSWVIPMKEGVSEHARYFIVQRDGLPISYGAVSSKATTDDMKEEVASRFNKKVLVPQKRNGGYISVTAKEDTGLKVEFAVVHRAEQGDPRVVPVLPGMSTVELKEDGDIKAAERSFRAFLDECIQDLPIIPA